jgi:hypothetical protein
MLNRGIFCLLRRKFYNEWPKYVLSLIRNVRPSNLLAAAGSFLGLHRLQRGRGKEISFPPPPVAYYVIEVRQVGFPRRWLVEQEIVVRRRGRRC